MASVRDGRPSVETFRVNQARARGAAAVMVAGVLALSTLGAAGPPSGRTRPDGESDGQVEARQVYAPLDGDIANPERGFYRQFVPFWLGTQRFPLADAPLAAVRQEGLSMVRAYFVLDEFTGTPLPRQALDAIADDFAAIRAAGLKIIPRIAYNFPSNQDYRQAQDAPLDRVLGHLDQLAPLLVANADIIAFVEAGFIGAWGEWHSSSNGLLEPDRRLNSRSAAILSRLLNVLPASRMVALRYPFHKQQLFGLAPLPPAAAFSGSAQARVGAHNDCFASGPTNAGTFAPPPVLSQTIDALKTYLSLDNRFVPQGGETCGAEEGLTALPPEAHCLSAVADLARLRWSTLNLDYHPAVLTLWRQEGCFDEVRRRLGYRFRLIDAQVQARAVPGRRWALTLRVANDGWAAPYNPRLAELVLRHRTTGNLARFPIAADPRYWAPGTTSTVSFEMVFPDGLEEGPYELLLHLPDPERGLYGQPVYSIRFANTGVWEAGTGFNRLLADTTVVPSPNERRAGCRGSDTRGRGAPPCTL